MPGYLPVSVEFFHSMLFSFYDGVPFDLWNFFEENPFYYRYITDNEKETVSSRFGGIDLPGNLREFEDAFIKAIYKKKSECHNCEFLDKCRGYFKWPDKNFACDGIKELFKALKDAANELKHDYASLENAGERKRA